ncbi:MAG: protoporphyrinogen oxidase [Bacteroidota bacterium]
MGPRKVDVVVIGAGISGLCAAHWLRKNDLSVLVLEKDAEVGGTMKTVSEDGFLSEVGPNSALETTPLFKELVSDLQLEHELVYANPAGKKRFVLKDGTLHALPLDPISFIRTPLFSAAAKLRLLKEPFVGRGTKEESIAEFVVRRLGQEFLDYAIDPFVAGVYAGRPEFLSVRAAFPKLYALEEEYGGLIRGTILGRKKRKARAEQAKDRAESFSFLSGMQAFPAAIARNLGSAVLTNAKVTALRDLHLTGEDSELEPDARRYCVEFLHGGVQEEVEADAVVLSTPAFAAAPLVLSFSRNTAQVLTSIQYSPVISVFLGVRKSDVGHSLDGFGFLVPTRERRKILGCLWSSSLFPGRCPHDAAALTVFVGGGRQPELTALSDEQIVPLVLDELKSIMQIQGKPLYLKVTRWAKAIPQYEIGYKAKVDEMEQFEEAHEGIFFCGNYRGGIAVGDCLQSSYAVSERVSELLRTLSPG